MLHPVYVIIIPEATTPTDTSVSAAMQVGSLHIQILIFIFHEKPCSKRIDDHSTPAVHAIAEPSTETG